jgi:hypothetical protein
MHFREGLGWMDVLMNMKYKKVNIFKFNINISIIMKFFKLFLRIELSLCTIVYIYFRSFLSFFRWPTYTFYTLLFWHSVFFKNVNLTFAYLIFFKTFSLLNPRTNFTERQRSSQYLPLQVSGSNKPYD